MYVPFDGFLLSFKVLRARVIASTENVSTFTETNSSNKFLQTFGVYNFSSLKKGL